MTAIETPLLQAIGVDHGFGTRDAVPPAGVVRPVQVHGTAVATPASGPGEADAIVSGDSSHPVGIVTADCVPILASSGDGQVVAAIHAGSRGLAAGVVACGIRALRQRAGSDSSITAVIGPHIGPCCYEVDDPVLNELRERFGAQLDDATRGVRPGHWLLDLGQLVELDLEWTGVAPSNRARIRNSCTCCNPVQFHSYRRDGAQAGRLLHHIRPKRSS